MASSITSVDRNKQVNDPWTTTDAGTGPAASERHEPAFEQEHMESGVHLFPAPYAAGYAAFNNVSKTYSWAWSKNLSGTITRVSIGLVELALSHPMRSADHWMVAAYPDWPEFAAAEEDGDFAKTQTRTRVRIFEGSRVLADAPFLIVVYGVRL